VSLSLIQIVTAISPNLQASFGASGGTPPYVFSVEPGGAGGTIDPSTGIYTAPAVTGVDTVEVTDATTATAAAIIGVCNPLELFCDIIANQMGLAQGQVYLWDQKITPPTDSRLYVAVGVVNIKPYGTSRSQNLDGSVTQQINFAGPVSIDIFSRGPDARDRKEEIILALNSIYSESQCEVNSLYIAPISSNFANLSELDGPAIPYRFNISVVIKYVSTKTVMVPYFNTFSPPTTTQGE
jgi:hypothetical protein